MLVQRPRIDPEKCNGCGLCMQACACNALTMSGDVVIFSGTSRCGVCTRWCCQCEAVCPVGAISCPFEIVIEEK